MKTTAVCLAILLAVAAVSQGDDPENLKSGKTDLEAASAGGENVPVPVGKNVPVSQGQPGGSSDSNHSASNIEKTSSVQEKTSSIQEKTSSFQEKTNGDGKATTPKVVDSLLESKVPEDAPELVSDSMLSATKRATYLLSGISVLILLYFVWKSYRLKRRQTHIHKYGVIANREDLEMTSLGFGSEDEEDDTIHFDKLQRS